MTQESPAASMMRSFSEAVGAATATQWRPGPSPASTHDLRARAGLPPARTVGDILGPPFTSAKEPLDPRMAAQPLPFPSHVLGHPVSGQLGGAFGQPYMRRPEATPTRLAMLVPPPSGREFFYGDIAFGVDDLPLVEYPMFGGFEAGPRADDSLHAGPMWRTCVDCRSIEDDSGCGMAGAPKRRRLWMETVRNSDSLTANLSITSDISSTAVEASTQLVRAAFAIVAHNIDAMESLFCVFMCEAFTGVSHTHLYAAFRTLMRDAIINIHIASPTHPIPDSSVPDGTEFLHCKDKFKAVTDLSTGTIYICANSPLFASACTLWAYGHYETEKDDNAKLCAALSLAMLIVHELTHLIGYEHPVPLEHCAADLSNCVATGFGYLMGLRYSQTSGCCESLISHYGQCSISFVSESRDASCTSFQNERYTNAHDDGVCSAGYLDI